MNFHIITIFPEIFNSYFNESIIKRAQEKKIIKINIYNLRDWTTDKHKTVDDTPCGGGAGMILKIEPLYKAIQDILLKIKDDRKNIRIILLSAKGKIWDQQKAMKYSKKFKNIILICGRYEGVDERILNFVDEEISVGKYVLTGGEIPVMTIVDSISRLLPNVLGNKNSIILESYSKPNITEYPQYTKPSVFIDNNKKTHTTPKVLLSGNHKKIDEWRKRKSRIIRDCR